MDSIRRSLMLSAIVLLLAGCAEEAAKTVVNAIVPPSKPSAEIVDPFKAEADLLTNDLSGIRFLVETADDKDKELFLKSSQDLRSRMSNDPTLKARLSSRMPAEIWLQSEEPNFDFEKFNVDAIQPFISIGKFETSDDIIKFLDTFPDRSLPEIANRIEKLEILDQASLGKGKFKFSISVGGNSIAKGILKFNKVESVLTALSESELSRISSISLGSSGIATVQGNSVSFQLNENSSASEWFDFIRANVK